MSNSPQGSILLWHDLVPVGRNAFSAWHISEHIPSRVNLPGFISGRRYAALDPLQGYLCWYELDDRGVLDADAYRSALEQIPSPREQSVEPYFQGIARSVSDITWSMGQGVGGLVAVYRYRVSDAACTTHREQVMACIAPLVADGQLVAASLHHVETHLNLRPEQARPAPTEVLILESAEAPADLESLCLRHVDPVLIHGEGVCLDTVACYRLQISMLAPLRRVNVIA